MTASLTPVPATSIAGSGPARARSLYAQAFYDTAGRVSARVGLTWIFIVATLGVFSPLIASSHPIAWKQAGKWSSPMLQNLNWADVTLFVLYVAGLILLLFFRRTAVWKRLLVWAGAGLLTCVIAAPLIDPPALMDYTAYRDAQRYGTAEKVIFTVIPFSPSDRQRDSRGALQSKPPSGRNWFGTTGANEDVASRMIHACRVATSIGFISTGISLAIGVIVGAILGYFAGAVDMVGMRLIEIFESIPQLLLLIMLVAFYGRNLYLLMTIIGLTTWTGKARFVRAEFLRSRKQDFVQAAVALGLPLRSILFRHILPNGLTSLIVSTSFGVATAILLESTLSFLGLGLEEEPSWGQLLDQARGNGTSFRWWLAAFPGGAIFLTVFAYNVIGEAVRDALDPKLRKRD